MHNSFSGRVFMTDRRLLGRFDSIPIKSVVVIGECFVLLYVSILILT